ncbi:MAG: polysaccharide deacetylase family protein [Nitrosotalea sp.]
MSRRHLDMFRLERKWVMVLPALSLLFLIPVHSFADTSGSIAVTLVYTNEDTADYWPVSFIVYQDTSQTPYKTIESITGNPFNIVSLPINHQYKIVTYANSMQSSVGYVDLQQAHQDVTIKLPLPGGMRINAFYNDGVTPIANATVYVRASEDNKTWGHSVTNADGESLRFWIEPTTSPSDYYIIDIHIGNHLVYSYFPVHLRPGIAQEIKITTNWPVIVNSLVTVKVLNSQSHLVQPTDGKFLASLFDSAGNKVSDSSVTSRGEADFSNLKVGDYIIKITKSDNNSEWATASFTEDGTNTIFNIIQGQNAPIISTTTPFTGQPIPPTTSTFVLPPQPVPNCNCVAFRLDGVQDYWLDDVQVKIIDSFDSKDAGITIGVVGKVFGNDSNLVNYLKSKSQDGNIDAAINGWSFEDFTAFTKDQQSNLLEQSKAKISSLLGITPTVFMPPYEKTNNDTLYAMASSNIGITSASPGIKIPQNLKIINYPTNVFAGVLAQDTNRSMLNDKILSSINDAVKVNGYAIVTLNFQDYAQGNTTEKTNTPDTEKIQNLQSLIDNIRNSGYRITTISNMENMFKPQAPWATSVFQWSHDRISNTEFLGTVKSMVPPQDAANYTTIPSWIKKTASLQSQGTISDDEFLNSIEYLVKIQAIK